MKLQQYLTENDNYKTKKDKTEHTHDISVDGNGDGKTISTKGDAPEHEHLVENWMVQSAKGHVHDMDI